MARKKSAVIGLEKDPSPEAADPGVVAIQTPSVSFTTSSTAPTCPHCNTAFQDLSITDFRDHVASCTRPSTADDDDSSGSSLSTPPPSPSHLLSSSATDVPENEAEGHEEKAFEGEAERTGSEVVDEPILNAQEVNGKAANADPQPYINPLIAFDYYDQSGAQEGSDADQNPPEPIDKFPFPKVTDAEVFEHYLQDAENLSYEELYRRTAVVSDNLVAYQTEWDAIDKEIFEHETYLRSEEKRIEEEAKATLEYDRLIEDEERDKVALKYPDQLRLNSKKWQEFITGLETAYPNDSNTIRHLQNLKNPQFMIAARKKKRTVENKQKNLENAPWPEVKKTKEDLELERRKRGRYMDPVKFDDLKQADVYGFEYSAHVKHYGQQPMALIARQLANANPTSNPFGDDPNDVNRTRTQRKQTRKVYEADASVTPEESEVDGKLPLKRARKPKIFIDGVETMERSRGQSRSGTPAVRTFASGKRVGRPPSKSKLQAVQLAQASVTPEFGSGSDSQHLVSGLQENDGDSRGLAAFQEAQLHDAAESLVNQTHFNQVAALLPAPKPKHPGGRPRKIRPENNNLATQTLDPAAGPAQTKTKNKGGRRKKTQAPPDIEYPPFEDPELESSIPKPKKSGWGGRRVKKEKVPEVEPQVEENHPVLQSTEQDEGSQYTSADTRPTTSDSNATASTFGSRRSARPTTRDKTNAREARAATLNRRDSHQGPPFSVPTSSRNKRKRNTSDVDLMPHFVQPAFDVAEPSSKKRRARKRQDFEDVVEDFSEFVPQVPQARTKRKRDSINEPLLAVPLAPLDIVPTPPKKRRRPAKSAAVETEEDSDAGIDETLLDPIAREALRKKRINKEKSRKLSRNMKARWASGGMAGAQESRKTNNALKRAWKKQALMNQAAGLPPPPPPVLMSTVAPTSSHAAPMPSVQLEVAPLEEAEDEYDEQLEEEMPLDPPSQATPIPKLARAQPRSKKLKRGTGERTESSKRSKTRPEPPKRAASKRAKRPSRMALGMDGANDEDDEIEQQFASEYDQFQALSSPKKPVMLGKRVRKSLVDLSQLMVDTEDDVTEDEDEEEEAEMEF